MLRTRHVVIIALLGLGLSTAAFAQNVGSKDDPTAGMKLSPSMRAQVNQLKRYKAQRAAAIAAAIESLRSTKEGDQDMSLIGPLGVTALSHREEIKQIAASSSLSDDKKLAGKLIAFYQAEMNRTRSFRNSSRQYFYYRDKYLEMEQDLKKASRYADARRKLYEKCIRDTSAVADGSGFTRLEKTARQVLRSKRGLKEILESVNAALRAAEREEGDASILDNGAKGELRGIKATLKDLDPKAESQRVPNMNSLAARDGQPDIDVYVAATKSFRDLMREHLDRLADPYEDYKDGPAAQTIKLCNAAPGVVRKYEARLKQLRGLHADLTKAIEEQRKLAERNKRGVTGRADD